MTTVTAGSSFNFHASNYFKCPNLIEINIAQDNGEALQATNQSLDALLKDTEAELVSKENESKSLRYP